MSEKVQKYELMLVLKPLLPDDVRKAIHKSVVSTLEEMDGDLVDTDVWGKRYLAYEIEGHNEGYYMLYHFHLPPAEVTEFKRLLSQKQEILRSMVIKIDEDYELSSSVKKKEIEE
jgi:small subunit ribosomal protein S6